MRQSEDGHIPHRESMVTALFTLFTAVTAESRKVDSKVDSEGVG